MAQMLSRLLPGKRRRPLWQYLLFPLFVFLVLLHRPVRLPSNLVLSTGKLTLKTPSAANHLQSELLRDYWEQLHRALTANKPDIPPVKTREPPKAEEMDASKMTNDSPRPNLIDMAEGDIEKLRSRHDEFVNSTRTLGPKLPFWKGTRGVVMPAGGGYLGVAVTSILMLRRSGSSLPVHVVLDSHIEHEPSICDVALPRMNAECLVLEDLLKGVTEVKHFQYKVLAMVFSPFEQVLFLDADAWPIHAPDRLFDTAPFTTHGLITWPDLWLGTVSPIYYRVARLEPPHILARRSSESGIMLYNKATHGASLLLAAYYNWYGPECYYPLLSQGAHGEGDKETFSHAATALGQPFWDVRTADGLLGRWIGDSFETAGMKQADPAEDYRLHVAAAGADHAREEPDEKKRKDARPLFIHHNLFKINIATIGSITDPLFKPDAEGRLTRLWGTDEKFVERSGFDVERALWDVILSENCGSSLLVECLRLRQWYTAVFVGASS
ncbi:Alpha-1,2-mannosyltransferase MNN23 [Colletotrichum chlorophyti]|uniref:Alpha-1,2-mannosyltransferase MNN23 n=1 Tax=Colletotrichum chlorophyti TaxID=708187 RepID=A0A1Q8S6U1_9PEZI|nr:Alpha-1,2-mannosyltransferase MNN23 [Colletotrichum chlorophyti]